MTIIKRNGTEAVFESEKIANAVTKANNSVSESCRMTAVQIQEITKTVTKTCETMSHAVVRQIVVEESGTIKK